ncbi:N-acetylmuramoyl-L-alanine amidase [Thermoanaerobacterium sp. RBIITD]|nr:N-acetylmuramoyl-L-alanine amidase [Thermoanaerobacterium sp. RBIITD]
MRKNMAKLVTAYALVLIIMLSSFKSVFAYAKEHVVSKGESLYIISNWYGSNVDAIKAANKSWDNTIYPGEKLVIPVNNITVNNSDTGNYLQNRYLIAKMIYAEARGESFEGQVAVGAVILNRVKSGIFPNSVIGVIYQPGAFEAVENGEFFNHDPDLEAFKAADAAISGWDPTGGALYYFNPATSSSPWIWSLTITNVIGNHWFGNKY